MRSKVVPETRQQRSANAREARMAESANVAAALGIEASASQLLLTATARGIATAAKRASLRTIASPSW